MLYIDLLTKTSRLQLTNEPYCLLGDNLSIVKYPIPDCVVHVCMHAR